MKSQSIKTWAWVHKWSSIVCTAFMLLLCVTGLPLIFNHELGHALYDEVEPAQLPADAPRANLDKVVANGLARIPGHAVQFMFWDRDEPEIIWLSIGKAVNSDSKDNRLVKLDALEKDGSDPELAAMIAEFRDDERAHRDAALAAGAERAPAYPLLSGAIRLGCRIAIRLAERI